MRVGFLFNHYAVHQVPHAAPYAFELSKRRPDLEVIIYSSSEDQENLARRIGELHAPHSCQFIRLHPPFLQKIIDPLLSRWVFSRKDFVLRNNLKTFRDLDVLVAPERHCLRLRTHYGIENLTLINTRHGAGDREGGFDERSGEFDFTLLPGKKYVDRLSEKGVLVPGRYAIAGWPKFDVVRGLHPKPAPLFSISNPVVVYNPHFDQKLSSWAPMGLEVLKFFADHPEFNLIFAPHIVMFMRDKRHRAVLPAHFENVPNILIDKGSLASSDMTYMRAADIYLGDVSSQVYEFLVDLKPCVFLNGHKVSWSDNPHYVHWKFGPVVDDLGDLKLALDRALPTHAEYIAEQKSAFDYTFHSEADSSTAEHGARLIDEFLTDAPNSG